MASEEEELKEVENIHLQTKITEQKSFNAWGIF